MKTRIFLECIAVSILVLFLVGCVTVRLSTGSGKPIAYLGPRPGASGTAPSPVTYSKVGIRHDVAKELPKDQALAFLRSLYVPEAANTCRFEPDGVERWWKGKLPGKNPYSSTYLSLEAVNGTPIGIMLSVRGTREQWCMIVPYAITQLQGGDAKKLTDKIFTALISLGVTIIPDTELSKKLHCRQDWCRPIRRG